MPRKQDHGHLEVLLSKQQLDQGVRHLARQIDECYGDRPLTIIGVLTGSIVLLADLIRLLEMPLRVGVVQANSYDGTHRGELRINADLMPDIQGRDVLLVDDILDSGHTLKRIIKLTEQLGPRSVPQCRPVAQDGVSESHAEVRFCLF